jgi:hypothetical protein
LRLEVAALEKEYAALNRSVEGSLAEQSKRKQMIQDVIALDQENQDLRAKIGELSAQLNILGQ